MLSRINKNCVRAFSNATLKQTAIAKISQERGKNNALTKEQEKELTLLEKISPKNRYCEEYANFAKQLFIDKK